LLHYALGPAIVHGGPCLPGFQVMGALLGRIRLSDCLSAWRELPVDVDRGSARSKLARSIELELWHGDARCVKWKKVMPVISTRAFATRRVSVPRAYSLHKKNRLASRLPRALG
jgi:hypothetical protein